MLFLIQLVGVVLVLAGAVVAVPTIPARRALTGYAPVAAVCPTTPLLRKATGVSKSESNYYDCRYPQATAGLQNWLKTLNVAFNPTRYPAIGLTVSGGGYRSLLEGAGVIQALDKRDSNTGVSGLFQGLTYQAGLSGGSWLLSSLAGNNYPTITSLKTGLWESAFQQSLLVPANLFSTAAAGAYSDIAADIVSKQSAGFAPTLTDPWGRLLSYQLLLGADGGVSTTMSGIASLSNFTSCAVPFPIITALGVQASPGQCVPMANATQYEFSPFEFGSWDTGVSAFTPTAYLGTSLADGITTNTTCVKNYDNLGYILGTSSNLFNELCSAVTPANSTSNNFIALTTSLEALVAQAHSASTRDLYGVYKNPFRAYPRAARVARQRELTLVDGGEANQNNPIWPFLHRNLVDALIVNDNSADTLANFPNGSEIYVTYQQAMLANLTRMPVIPPSSEFVAKKLNQRPTFFGCNDTSKLTIIYLPNYNYTYPSNQSTLKLQYERNETDGMIANGVQIATQGGDTKWPTCLACGLMKKAGGNLPDACTACFEQYCYN